MSGFFRYPGGKSKLRKEISKHLNIYSECVDLEYREPFFGGGSVGLGFLSDNPDWKKIWINDFDVGVANLWTCVIRYPEELKEMVLDFNPSVDKFDEIKEDLVSNRNVSKKKSDIVLQGFKKLAIHQISYSGLGTKSGGPLGGRGQKSKYKIDCRWSPDYICKKIDRLNKQFEKFDIKDDCCTSFDFEELITSKSKDAFLYLDPPYYAKGNDLYQCAFTEKDHKRLAEALDASVHPWILSYDDCPEVRDLYKNQNVETLFVNYSITAIKDKKTGERQSRKKCELIIYPKKHKEILCGNSARDLLSKNG